MNGLKTTYVILSLSEKGIKVIRNNIHYFDYAATTFMCDAALNGYNAFHKNIGILWGKGHNELATLSKNCFDEAIRGLHDHFNIDNEYGVLLGKNTTEVINVIAYSIEHMIQPWDVILVGPYEHHSNYLPWKYLAKRTNAMFIEMPLDSDGNIDLKYLKSIAEKVRVVAYSTVANTNGFFIKKIINSIFKEDTMIFTDESQMLAHSPLEISKDVAGYILSSHKMYGPKNIAAAFLKNSLIEHMNPVILGGGMIESQQFIDTWSEGEYKFYSGTYDVGLLYAWKMACDYIDSITYSVIHKEEQKMYDYIAKFLTQFKCVKICSSDNSSKSILSFSHSHIHPHDIEEFLSHDNVIIRSGNMCAQNALRKIGYNALNRISFGVGITDQDINALCESLEKCFRMLDR